MFTVTLNKAKYIERNKDAIKRYPSVNISNAFICNLLMPITPLYL